MPSTSTNTLVWFRWAQSGLDAYLCRLNNPEISSPQALRFEGPIQVMSGDEFVSVGRTTATPFFLEANPSLLNERKILCAFTGHQVTTQCSWNEGLKAWRLDYPNAHVLQIGKHLAYLGRSKRLNRNPEAKEDDASDPVASLVPASMVQLDDYIYLHNAVQYQGHNAGPYRPRRDWIISDLHAAKLPASDVWKAQQSKEDGIGAPPGAPATRLLYRIDRVKNDYVHFIDVQRPLDENNTIYSIDTDHEEAPDEARTKRKPWIQIHQMTKKEFLVGPSRKTLWNTFQFTVPDYCLHNYPYLFTTCNDDKVPIPIVTANGKIGYRLWLFTNYWNGVYNPQTPGFKWRGNRHTLFGVYLDIRPDGSIDSYSKTPEFKGGYHIDLGEWDLWGLRATTIDYSKSGTDDYIVFTMEVVNEDPRIGDYWVMPNNAQPRCLCVPIRSDGTIGSGQAKETAVKGIFKDELSDLLQLQIIKIPGIDKFPGCNSTGLLLAPNDFV